MKTIKAFKSIIFVIFLVILPFVVYAIDLYSDEVNIKAKEGKDLVMSFEEMERHDKYSIVKVKHISGASVPSIMFVAKGCYEIAKLRESEYFINLKEWTDEEGNRIYIIGYSNDNTVEPMSYYGDIVDKSKDLEFTSVKDYDLIFRPE